MCVEVDYQILLDCGHANDSPMMVLYKCSKGDCTNPEQMQLYDRGPDALRVAGKCRDPKCQKSQLDPVKSWLGAMARKAERDEYTVCTILFFRKLGCSAALTKLKSGTVSRYPDKSRRRSLDYTDYEW